MILNSPLRSVETPVANRPREATAREPPRSTESNIRHEHRRLEIHNSHTHTSDSTAVKDIEAVLDVNISHGYNNGLHKWDH